MGIAKRLLENNQGKRRKGISFVFEGEEVISMLNRMRDAKEVKKSDIRKEVRKALAPERKRVRNAAKAAMGKDLGRAYMGVKMVVYRDGNGGMLNILDKGNAKQLAVYKQPAGGKSGIRRRRYVSPETKRRKGYRGADRAFILRFINSGTEDRYTKVKGKGMKKSAYRGLLSTTNFFQPAAESGISRASRVLSERIAKLILEVGEGR